MRHTTGELGDAARASSRSCRKRDASSVSCVLNPQGCITRAGITIEKVEPRASLPGDVIPIPSLPGPRQVMREPQTPDRQSLV